MKIKYNILFYLFILFCFLPSLCFPIGKQFVPVYVPFTLISFFLICILKFKKLLNKVVYYYKKTPCKILIFFAIWSFITIAFSIIKGKFFIGGFIISTIGGLICSVILPFLITLFLVPRYIKLKNILKFIYIFSFFIFLLGFFEFFIYYFDVSVLKDFFSIFSNKRLFMTGANISTRIFVNSLPRIRAIFDEPSYLGYYIAIISPFIYEITLNKYQILKNVILNRIIKKTIIPLMFFCLILTQSPIFLIFNLIFTSYYFIFERKWYTYILKYRYYFTILLIIAFFSIFLLFNLDLSKTFLNRVFIVLQNLKSFKDFIMVEPSLATRLIVYINAIEMGFKNLFTGVGYGNMSYLIASKISSSNLPLTEEVLSMVINQKTTPPASIFVKLFSETGLLGCGLFYTFLINTYTNLKHFMKFNKFYRMFAVFLLFYIITSFYDSNFNQPQIFIIIALCIVLHRKEHINL